MPTGKPGKKEGVGCQKTAENTRHLKRNSFVNDLFNVSFVVAVARAILLATMAEISCHRKPGNMLLVLL